MISMIEKKFANEDLEIELTFLLMISKMFGSEKKMLLRSLDIVTLMMLLDSMLIKSIR